MPPPSAAAPATDVFCHPPAGPALQPGCCRLNLRCHGCHVYMHIVSCLFSLAPLSMLVTMPVSILWRPRRQLFSLRPSSSLSYPPHPFPTLLFLFLPFSCRSPTAVASVKPQLTSPPLAAQPHSTRHSCTSTSARPRQAAASCMLRATSSATCVFNPTSLCAGALTTSLCQVRLSRFACTCTLLRDHQGHAAAPGSLAMKSRSGALVRPLPTGSAGPLHLQLHWSHHRRGFYLPPVW